MWSLMNDAKFACRMAAKNPWMTLAAVVAIAGGMAVTIAGFSLLWGSYFAELPFEHAGRIVAVRDIEQPDPDDTPPKLSVFREWERRQSKLDLLAASYRRLRDVADGEGGLIRYPVATMTASGFDVAGVPPLHGRTLGVADQEPGSLQVVVISHRVWRSVFGSDPDAVGQILQVGGENRTIVGIMPEGFRFPVSEDLWIPMNANPVGGVEPRWLQVFGRLAPGVTMEQAEAELDAIRSGYANEHPNEVDLRDRRTTVLPYIQSQIEPGTDIVFLGLFVFLVLVLVVACASVANLLLARAASRTGEIAVRAAMGATRRRLVIQLLIEASLLSSAGAVLGVIVARVGLEWFESYVAIEMLPFWIDFGMSPAVVIFAAVAAFGAAVISGIVPASRATGDLMHDVLKDRQGAASSMRFGSVSAALTIAEVSLSVAFLAGATLAGESLLVAGSLDRKLPTQQVLVAEVALVNEFVVDEDGQITVLEGSLPPSQWATVQEEIRMTTERLPGARFAVIADRLPGQQHFQYLIEVENDAASRGRMPVAVVSPEFFATFDGTLLVGRNFGPVDTAESEPVAIVNASFARRFFGVNHPVGERLRLEPDKDGSEWIRIVGVVADLRMNPGSDNQAGLYLPVAQRNMSDFTLALRVDGDPLSMSAAVKNVVKRTDSRIDVAGFQTHEQLADGYLVTYKVMSLMFTVLGGTAFFLALAGLYAVMAFSVAQRTREIGIRLALGADRRSILGVVLRRGLFQIGIGIALGSAMGWALLRLMQSVPIGMASGGAGMLAIAAAAMAVCGLMACIVPASRTLGINPVEAIRHE